MRILILITAAFLLLMNTSCTETWKKTASGVKYEADSVSAEVTFFSPEIVRVVKTPVGTKPEKESLSVIKIPETTDLQINDADGTLSVKSSAVEVRIDLVTGQVTFYDLEGKLLLGEQARGTAFRPFNDAGRDTWTVRQTFSLDADEQVYGLGQFQQGKMSQRNQELFMRQDNKETVVPMLHSSKGYGLFWDNYSPTTFFDDPSQTWFESQAGDMTDYYFMYGGNADGVIAQMRDLTGEVPMFPRWTYGYWQSKERYQSQDETVGVVKKYRALGVPLDGIIQDWQYWGDNYHWNAMEFLNPEFPEPKRMIDEVHGLNAHIIISCWASFGPKTKQYEVMNEKGMLMDFTTWPIRAVNTWPAKPGDPLSGVRVYDPYNPEARDIYWDFMNKGIFSLGMDGWWLDSTEPDHMEIEEEDFDNKTYLGSFRSVRNAFPLMTVGGVYDHQRKTTSDKRVFILTRSAFAGQQRYGANSWSGDVVTNWDVLRKQISAGLNFSLAGIPYWNSDIGGFFVWRFPGGVKNKAFHEIYVRWLQFGTFCPMMRSHGTDTPREIWQFGEKGDWTYDAIEKYINLRYRLLPYTYSTSWQVTSNASSMMRALVMDFVEDKNALDIDDQYMFGESMLVCPVTEPMYVDFRKDGDNYVDAKENFDKVKSISPYLPAGTAWYDFWTGDKLEGGQTVERATPIDIIPIYVKAGSILPLGPRVQYAEEKTDPIELRIYPGADASFTLYEDEGDNYNYEKGQYATIELKWDDSERKLTIGERNGEYPGMKAGHQFEVVIVGANSGTGLESATDDVKKVDYQGAEMTISL